MKLLGESFDASFQRSAYLVSAGLLVILPTLFWNHAFSFILYGSLGLALTLAGIVIFLYALATR